MSSRRPIRMDSGAERFLADLDDEEDDDTFGGLTNNLPTIDENDRQPVSVRQSSGFDIVESTSDV